VETIREPLLHSGCKPARPQCELRPLLFFQVERADTENRQVFMKSPPEHPQPAYIAPEQSRCCGITR